jgi:hypothetical protein
VPDAVGEDEEVPARVQCLPLAKQFVSELGSEEARPAAGRPVEDEDRVANDTVLVFTGRPNGAVIQAEFGEQFSGSEPEVTYDEVARGGLG